MELAKIKHYQLLCKRKKTSTEKRETIVKPAKKGTKNAGRKDRAKRKTKH